MKLVSLVSLVSLVFLLSACADNQSSQSSAVKSDLGDTSKSNESEQQKVATSEYRLVLPGAADLTAPEMIAKLNSTTFATFQPTSLLKDGFCEASIKEIQIQDAADGVNDLYLFMQMTCSANQGEINEATVVDLIEGEYARRVGTEPIIPRIRPFPSVTGSN